MLSHTEFINVHILHVGVDDSTGFGVDDSTFFDVDDSTVLDSRYEQR